MKKLSLLAPILLSMTMVSCEEIAKNNNENALPKNISVKYVAGSESKENAESLTRAGEIMMTRADGILRASEIFDLALKNDPTNNKARFYKGLLEIIISTKGVASAISPLTENQIEYENSLSKIMQDFKYPEVIDFIKGSGLKKITTYKEAQDLIRTRIQPSFERAISELQKVDGEVELILGSEARSDGYSCSYSTSMGEGNIQETSVDCERDDSEDFLGLAKPLIVKVDEFDTKAIVGSLKAYQSYIRLMTSYSIEGVKEYNEQVIKVQESLGRELTDKENDQLLQNYPKLMVLRTDHEVDGVLQNAEDMIDIARDFDALNNKFCETNLRADNILKNICVSEEARAQIDEALDYISGPKEVTIGLDKDCQEVKVLTNLSALLTNPVVDLKNVLEKNYDEEGNRLLTQEPELNGLFPNRDYLGKTKLVVNDEACNSLN